MRSYLFEIPEPRLIVVQRNVSLEDLHRFLIRQPQLVQVVGFAHAILKMRVVDLSPCPCGRTPHIVEHRTLRPLGHRERGFADFHVE